jgi:CubicO group peptidase (beta-lactamase class C family)
MSHIHSRRLLPMLSIGCFVLFTPTLSPAQGIQTQAIDDLVKDAMKQWHVPGLALGIVQDGRVIYLKGHGVRDTHRPESVTPDTVFPLASCTKPFTSLAVAMLVSEGKMSWDDPVRKHVSFFHLSDPLADANVTIRDLLSHRTGVGNHDFLWYKAPWELEERIRKIGKVPLEDSFRSRFHYQTILFGAAGYAAGKAAGSDWGDLVQKRILNALEMKSSSPVFTIGPTDFALPHRRNAEGKIESMPRYPLDKPDPAGSVHASARDLTHFLRFQLGDGTWQGRRLVGADELAEMHAPQMVVRREGFAKVMNPESVQVSYGLGWIIQDYRGRLLLQHGGAIDGFRSHLSLVPQAKLGIVLLNNLDRGFMNLALSNALIDQVLGAPFKDWNTYYRDMQAQDEAAEKARMKQALAGRKPGTKPSLPLEAYAGKYVNAAYGPCEISLENARLHWKWANWRCEFEHFQDDIFLAKGEGLLDSPVEFQLSKDRKVASVRIIEQVFERSAK